MTNVESVAVAAGTIVHASEVPFFETLCDLDLEDHMSWVDRYNPRMNCPDCAAVLQAREREATLDDAMRWRGAYNADEWVPIEDACRRAFQSLLARGGNVERE